MKEEAYKKILSDLESEINVEGSCIVSRDGILIYSSLKDVYAEAFAAMLATLLSSAEVAMDELKAGVPKRVIVDGKNKKIVVVGAGSHALLASITEENADEVYEAMIKAAKKIDKVLSGKND
ncbi:MAG TPA: roadblock/LC7 domain-containing protein [Thermoplasmatales archaeon]|nr:roadblock/LC7 domain-containing protein [Thermoplasmatales archaeon]